MFVRTSSGFAAYTTDFPLSINDFELAGKESRRTNQNIIKRNTNLITGCWNLYGFLIVPAVPALARGTASAGSSDNTGAVQRAFSKADSPLPALP